MFSSPPPQTCGHQPLPVICENIQRLGVRTKRETEQYLREYAAAQARNRGLYAVQGERERKTWDVEEPQTYQRSEKGENYRVAGIESPLLKARLHLSKKEREETLRVDIGDRASINIEKEMTGPDEDGKESRQHTDIVTSRENATRRKQVENDDDNVREENERNMRLAQRRARRRAKKEIISPSAPTTVLTSEYQELSRKRERDEEKDGDNDGRRDMRTKKKRKSKVTLGISLMENFTAKNVGHGRLTLPPPSHAGLFNKGRASMRTEIKKYGKENRRPANIFSEFEFLNKPNTPRKKEDKCSSSSSQPSVGRESPSSILPLTKVLCQAGKRVKCPSERETKEASLPLRGTRKSPSRPDTSSEQHSASWGLGSVLPSDDESVRAAPLQSAREPRQLTVTAEETVGQGTSPGVPSRQGSPEVVIKTIPSKWRSDEADDVEGRFQPQSPAKQTTSQDTRTSLQDARTFLKGKYHCQDTTEFRSRFFPVHVPSPDHLLPSSPRIPDVNEHSPQEFREEPSIVQAEFLASLSGDPHPVASYPLKIAADDPHIAHNQLSDDPMPLAGHASDDRAMGDRIYPANSGLTMAHFIDEHLGAEADFDVPTDDCLDFCGDPLTSLDARRVQEPMETHDLWQGSSAPELQWDSQYCGSFYDQNVDGSVWCDALDWEESARWNDNTRIEGGSYEGFLSYSQDHKQADNSDSMDHGGSTFAGVDHEAYCQVWSTDMHAEETEPPNEVQDEGSIVYEGQGSEEEDVMLEFSEGRTLLMGMGDGILAEKPSRKPGFDKLHPDPKPYRLQFGQSVNEIEVMVGKDLGNLWKR